MKLTLRFKGGEGSGNYGHEGRPGEVGGSGPGGGITRPRGFDNDTHIKTVSAGGKKYEIHKRNGRMYILGENGYMQPSGIRTRDAETFLDKFAGGLD